MAKIDASTPLWQWKTQQGSPEERLLEIEQLAPGGKIQFIELLFPATLASALAPQRVLGLRDGVLLGIALELYRRQMGKYPQTLEDLSPRWIPEIPVDRINGGPLGYQLVDGKPIVYSLGIDGDDDGGRLPGYMNDVENKRLGYTTTKHYRVGPPLSTEELTAPRPPAYIGHDGDWVLWSLGEERYQPRGDFQAE